MTAEGEGEEQPPQEEGEGDEKIEKSDEPKHLFINQVFREKKMKFFKVPSLGSYLAIKLSYNSCMSDKAIKEAILDKIDVDRRREEQEIARKEYEEEQEIAKDSKDEHPDEEEGEKVWEEIKEKDFITHENKYTVCFDTMGQDRSLTHDQIKFALDVIKEYAHVWEETEKANLKKEIEKKVNSIKKDKEYLEVEGPNIQNDEERYVDDMLSLRDDIETDEQRDREVKVYKFHYFTRQLSGLTTEPDMPDEPEEEKSDPKTAAKDKDKKVVDKKLSKKDDKKPAKKEDKKIDKTPKPKETKEKDGEEDGEKEPRKLEEPRLDERNNRWRQEILSFKDAKEIRFPRIFQGIFYLLGYTREQI
jgi:hypothetical protein